MNNFIVYALVLFIGGCASKPEQRSLKDLFNLPTSTWPDRGWHADYDLAIAEAAKGRSISGLPCKDLTATIKAIATAESGLKNSTVYKEPPPLNVNSIGLLQLSLNDQKNYGLDCGWKSESDIKHPIKNLFCGTRILASLLAKHPSENFYRAGGRYWSVLRRAQEWPGKKQDGYNRFVAACIK